MSDYITSLSTEEIQKRVKDVIKIKLEIKNKKALYEMLDLKPPEGKAKKYHDNILRCFFDWKKIDGKQALVIIKVYDEPLVLPKRGRPKKITEKEFHLIDKNKNNKYAHLVSHLIVRLLIEEHPEVLRIVDEQDKRLYAVFRRTICGGIGILPVDYYKVTKSSKRRNENIKHLLGEVPITEQEILLICNTVDMVSRNFFRVGMERLKRMNILDYYSDNVFKNDVGQWYITTDQGKKQVAKAEKIAADKTKWRNNEFSNVAPRYQRTQMLYDHYINESLRRLEKNGLKVNYRAYIVSINYNALREYWSNITESEKDNVNMMGELQQVFKQVTAKTLFKESKKYSLVKGDRLPDNLDRHITSNIGKLYDIIIDYWLETKSVSNMMDKNTEFYTDEEKNVYFFFNEIKG